MDLVERASHLLERARWKDEGWDKPTPPEILEKWANASGLHVVHMSEIGPGNETTSPNDPDSDQDPTPRDVGGFKAGVNPDTSYNTPVGVYGYPLTNDTYRKWFGSDQNKPPFAGRRDWMYILKHERGGGERIELDRNGSSWEWSEQRTREEAARIAEKRPRMVGQAIEKRGQVLGIAYPGDLQDDVRRVMQDPSYITRTYFFEAAVDNARLDTPFNAFWNFTRKVAENGGSGAPDWTDLLLDVVGIGTIYDEGSGTVHENEPTQVVFLDAKSYEVVDVTENVWDWREKKAEREQAPGRLMLKAAEHYGFEDITSKIDPLPGQNELAAWKPIGAEFRRYDWLKGLVKRAEGTKSGGKLELTYEYSNEAVSIGYARYEGWSIDPRIPGSVMFSGCEFVDCEAGDAFFRAVLDAPGDKAVFRMPEFRGCRFTVERDTLVELTGAESDAGVRSVKRYVEGDDEVRAAPGVDTMVGKLFGVSFESAPEQLEDCTLEVV